MQLRFTRLAFGLRSSPAMLSSTTHHQSETQKDSDPQLIELLRKSLCGRFCVLVSGPDNEKKAYEVSSNAKLTMQEGVFNLRKWNTNSNENVECDDELSNEHLKKWGLQISDLQSLNNVCVQRCMLL